MKKIIGIDFDGTCVTDLYPYVGDNIGAASVLRELGDKNLLILYTVRDGKYLQDAVDWFRYNHINLYSVNYNPEPVSSSPKLYCDYYIDDRNIGTPLTDKGYVDWNKMLVLLKQKNLKKEELIIFQMKDSRNIKSSCQIPIKRNSVSRDIIM